MEGHSQREIAEIFEERKHRKSVSKKKGRKHSQPVHIPSSISQVVNNHLEEQGQVVNSPRSRVAIPIQVVANEQQNY